MNTFFHHTIVLFGLLLLAGASNAQTQTGSGLSPATNIIFLTQNWQLKPQADVPENGDKISTPAFNSSHWQAALVPGTSFTSYIPHDGKTGVEKNPDYADNIYEVDPKKYDRNFWYRTEFDVPTSYENKRVWLHFEGINKKGEVYINGKYAGLVDGLAQRAAFAFTPQKGKNAVAVLVHVPLFIPGKHNLANGESPTYVCSQGWDWMPRVPGLNSGITDDVYLSTSGDVTIEDPWIRTDSLMKDKAVISLSTSVTNHANQSVTGTLTGTINPGNIILSKQITLNPGEEKEIKMMSRDFPQLIIQHPKLWWPNGYGGKEDGTQNLYTADFTFTINNTLSDNNTKHFGIRKYAYDTIGGPLHVWVNGVRIFLKGGNWGMSDYLLRCRGEEYDTKIRFHKEMNFNMIRNWTGETTDEEWYDACDKYGIMVWDDFWLNNLGPIDSLALFERNAIEKVKRYRDHPCIAIWCGANEGLPGGSAKSDLNQTIARTVAVYDGNNRRYQPRSNAGTSNEWLTGDSHNLSGSGIWTHEEPKTYFTDPHNGYPWSKHSYSIRTELGTAVFPNVESFKKFMPAENLWPRDSMWDKHFFSNDGAYGGGASPTNYMEDIAKRYGASNDIDDFCRKAQLMNLETNKAMFEGWQENMWRDASGLLIWMSQSSYPSMIWQTYDFYYDLTGAYFGAKSACEPVHIQWNAANDSISIINNRNQLLQNITAEWALFNSSGEEVPHSREKSNAVTIMPTSKKSVARIHPDNPSLSDVYFIKLKLKDADGRVLSQNEYWNGKEYLDYTAINSMPSCLPYLSLSKGQSQKVKGNRTQLHVTITNSNKAPVAALAIRIQPMSRKTGEPILPAVISDSYFSLMKGESKEITIEFDSDLVNEKDCYIRFTPYNGGAKDSDLLRFAAAEVHK